MANNNPDDPWGHEGVGDYVSNATTKVGNFLGSNDKDGPHLDTFAADVGNFSNNVADNTPGGKAVFDGVAGAAIAKDFGASDSTSAIIGAITGGLGKAGVLGFMDNGFMRTLSLGAIAIGGLKVGSELLGGVSGMGGGMLGDVMKWGSVAAIGIAAVAFMPKIISGLKNQFHLDAAPEGV